MDYNRSLLVYDDRPGFGLLFKIIMFIPLIMIGAGLYMWFLRSDEGGLFLVGEAVFVAILFWFILPRGYQVYEDHLRIVLGGPLSIKIGFQSIKDVIITGRTAFTANMVTRPARKYVEIIKNGGINYAITPRSYEIFVESAHRAMENWRKSNTLSRVYEKR